MTIPLVLGVINFSNSLIGGRAKLFSILAVTALIFAPVITAKAA